MRIASSLVFAFLVLAAGFSQPQFTELAGWGVQLDGVQAKGDLTTAQKATIPLPGLMGSGEFVVPQVQIDASGNVVKSGIGKAKVEFRSTNGYRVVADQYRLSPGGLVLGGTVFLPQALGERGLVFTLGALSLSSEGALTSSPSTQPVRFSFAEYAFEASETTFEASSIALAKVCAVLEPAKTKLEVGTVRFSSAGEWLGSEAIEKQSEFDAGSYRILVRSAKLSETSVELSGQVRFAAPLSGAAIEFDSLVVSPVGSVTALGTSSGFEVERAGIVLRSASVRGFSSLEGLRLEGVTIALPQPFEDSSIAFESALLHSDGSLDTYNFDSAPTKLLGKLATFGSPQFAESSIEFRKGFLTLLVPSVQTEAPIDVAISSARWDTKTETFTIEGKVTSVESIDVRGDWTLGDLGLRWSGKTGESTSLTEVVGALSPLSPWAEGTSSSMKVSIPLSEAGDFEWTKTTSVGQTLVVGNVRATLSLKAVTPEFEWKWYGTARHVDSKLLRMPNGARVREVFVDEWNFGAKGEWGTVVWTTPSRPRESFAASFDAGIWKLIGVDREQPAVVSKTAKTKSIVRVREIPSESGRVTAAVGSGVVLELIERSRERATVGGVEDYWYFYLNRGGFGGWIFGSELEPLER